MKKLLLIIILILTFILPGCASPDESVARTPTPTPAPEITDTATPSAAPSPGIEIGDEALTVTFLDVGQADCAIISDGRHTILIDAGNNGDGDLVVDYLRSQGITDLDYVVGTHFHEDHIGGLDTVISNIPVGAVIMPKGEGTTATYDSLISAMDDNSVERIDARAGDVYTIGNFTMHILGPVKEYTDANTPSDESVMNNNSVVVKIVFGSTSFLLTGDIERQAETDIVAMQYDITCDVLKAAHHGSNSSSTYVFLRESNPEMIVISCGADNSYGHPHEDALSRYRDLGATVYRTDTMGTIIITSDGLTITANTVGIESPREHIEGEDNGLVGDGKISIAEYIGNANSLKFHVPSCANLPAEKNQIIFTSRKEAIDAGYTPCGNCQP